jgi:uroporphyrinogen decarboxylase
MRFEPVDRLPNWEMGYWASTIDRWYDEGLPAHPDAPRGLVPGAGIKGEGFPWRAPEPRDASVRSYFQFDRGLEKVAGEWGVFPYFAPQVLAEDEQTVTRRDPDGTVVRVRKDSASLPHEVDWPVSDRASWEALKRERLQPDTPGRFPANWEQLLAHYGSRDFPLILGGPFLGAFSALRTLFGFERVMYLFHDEPDLIDDVLSHLIGLWLALFEEVLAQTDVDCAYYWEDMSYKGGPMVSPRVFQRFLAPVYRRINGFFGAHSIDIILLDTDGDVWKLIPWLTEVGVSGLYPFEVRAGMDVAAVRRAYPHLQMLGGIDKTALATGGAAIDRELERIVPVMCSGGYIPGCDHYVSPDVPWEHFVAYRRKLARLI